MLNQLKFDETLKYILANIALFLRDVMGIGAGLSQTPHIDTSQVSAGLLSEW